MTNRGLCRSWLRCGFLAAGSGSLQAWELLTGAAAGSVFLYVVGIEW